MTIRIDFIRIFYVILFKVLGDWDDLLLLYHQHPSQIGILLEHNRNTNFGVYIYFLWFYFSFYFFIGVQLLYNVVLVSAVQHSESALSRHIAPLFVNSFPSRSPQYIVFCI